VAIKGVKLSCRLKSISLGVFLWLQALHAKSVDLDLFGVDSEGGFMSSIFKEIEGRSSPGAPTEARIFLEFKYAEIKDLLKHFLTLISASLVFSVAFSEKIIDFDSASSLCKLAVIGAWFILVLALGSCGVGIYTLYLASERAIASLLGGPKEGYRQFVRVSYLFQDAAGLLFGIGLCLLIIAAIMK
jgi:hypothetical protein